VVTKLKEEEPLFPRGGGSVLTPLEQKQISIQAKKDVLFEEHSAAQKGEKASRKKRRKSRADETADKPTKDDDAVKIESLNFKVRQRLRECRGSCNRLTCCSGWSKAR
jgi:rRNA biogenesis protein RRP5